MKGKEVNRRSQPNKQSFGILTRGSAITAIQEVTILSIRGMITIVFGVTGASSRSRSLRVGEAGDGFAISAVIEVTKATTQTRPEW